MNLHPLPRLALSATLLAASFAAAGCDIVTGDGWIRQPFAGPGYSQESGLSEDIDPDADLLVGTTLLYVGDDGEAQPLFDEHMVALQKALDDGPEGMVGYSFSQSLFDNVYRTVSVWESQEALFAFVFSEAHLAAMNDVDAIAQPDVDSKVHDYTMKASELPPKWDDVIQRLDDDGRVAAY
jgi:quinol monooxygenase YgiN